MTGDASSDLLLTHDKFLGGQLTLAQPKQGYRAGLDAVLLGAAVQMPSNARQTPYTVLDVGAGVGTVGLSIATRCRQAHVTLLEPQTTLADLALQNVATNNLGGRVQLVTGGIGSLSDANLSSNSFDCVVSNPPYHDEARGTPAPNTSKATANAMPAEALDAWIRFMTRMASPGGTAILIHKAAALVDLLEAMSNRFGDLTILPIQSHAHESAIRILVAGVKGSRAPPSIRPALVLYDAPGQFSPIAHAILRDGEPLVLRPRW